MGSSEVYGSERSCFQDASPATSIRTTSMQDLTIASAHSFLNNDSFTEIDLTTDSGVVSA